MTIKKVLLVDDSKTELHHLSDMLSKRGYAVRTAENGEEAMRRLAEDKPDLILMDVVMPGQNGFQLTRAITRDPAYADVPVIMLSSKDGLFDKARGRMVGSEEYLTKPFTKEQLLRAVEQFSRYAEKGVQGA